MTRAQLCETNMIHLDDRVEEPMGAAEPMRAPEPMIGAPMGMPVVMGIAMVGAA